MAAADGNSLLKEAAVKADKIYYYKDMMDAAEERNSSSSTSLLDVFLKDSDSSLTNSSLATIAGEVVDVSERGIVEMLALGLILGLLDLVTILGNLLVCVTILNSKKLQSCTNLFIFSLSWSDLLLGVIVLPFSTLTTLTGHWPLGTVFYNIYISSDVMLCTVSILQLFAISLDRYVAVTWPFRYLQIITKTKVYFICGGIWIFAFLMGFMPIHLGWNTEDGDVQNQNNPSMCVFESNEVYVLLVAVGTYFFPLIIMCGVYIRVFLIAKQQVKRINELTKYGAVSNGSAKDQSLASDTKATFTLASVVTAFTICWLPYFVLFTAKPFLATPVDPNVDLFVLWLGYVNSLLNPFLYAFHNSEFRYGFMLVLCRKRAERYRDRHPDVVHL